MSFCGHLPDAVAWRAFLSVTYLLPLLGARVNSPSPACCSCLARDSILVRPSVIRCMVHVFLRPPDSLFVCLLPLLDSFLSAAWRAHLSVSICLLTQLG
jgi:hypothetical protein